MHIDTIKELRHQRGLTAEQLGQAVGVTRMAVTAWETQDVYPRAELLPLIADALGVSIDELFRHTPIITKS